MRVADRTPKEQEEWRARLRNARWGNAKTALRIVEFCSNKLSRPPWAQFGVDPKPINDWFKVTHEKLKTHLAQQPRRPRWPLPKVGDEVAVRERHLERYVQPELGITADVLKSMVVEAASKKAGYCVVTVVTKDKSERTYTIPFLPRHLKPIYATESNSDTPSQPPPSGEEIRGPSVDDDAGEPVGDEEEDDDFESEDEDDDSFEDEDEEEEEDSEDEE